MEEEIKALVKVVNDLVEQNKILIQILLSRPQNINDGQANKLRSTGSGLFGDGDKCRKCGEKMKRPMYSWIGDPPPKRCERCSRHSYS